MIKLFMQKFEPFRQIHFIEILFDVPWKPIISLVVLTYIAALWDAIYSFWFKKDNTFDNVNGVFSTLLNTNSFLLWIFFIAFLSYFFLSIFYNFRIHKGKKISGRSNILVKTFDYRGFFIIEIFYLIGAFCSALTLLALIILDFPSLLSFSVFSFIFLGIAIGIHWIFLSFKVKT